MQLLVYLVSGACLDQYKGEIIPLSQKVGSEIDSEENIFYNIFPDINGFVSGQFYALDGERYTARIVFIEYSYKVLSSFAG